METRSVKSWSRRTGNPSPGSIMRRCATSRSRDAGSPFGVQVCAAKDGLAPVPVPWPELIVFSALNPAAGELFGTSLLAGLPFVSDVLMKIYALDRDRTSSGSPTCATP